MPLQVFSGLGHVRFRAMPEVLRSADIVSLHVPLTPATRKLIGARELGLMKSSAILINTCCAPWWTRRRCTRR